VLSTPTADGGNKKTVVVSSFICCQLDELCKTLTIRTWGSAVLDFPIHLFEGPRERARERAYEYWEALMACKVLPRGVGIILTPGTQNSGNFRVSEEELISVGNSTYSNT